MAYTKNYVGGWVLDNPPGTSTTPITAACLDNIETQYTEAASDLTTDAADTSTHGAADIADVADIAVDANLSAAAQAAVAASHAQNADTAHGVQTADMDMGGFTVTNLAVPTADDEAATKEYVDDLLVVGHIWLWQTSVGAIPTGWTYCNGAAGTPDLRSSEWFVPGCKFIKKTT